MLTGRSTGVGPEGARIIAAGLKHVPCLTELELRRGGRLFLERSIECSLAVLFVPELVWNECATAARAHYIIWVH